MAWFIAVMGCTGGLGYQLFLITSIYLQYNVSPIVSKQTSRLQEFPAVTVCNTNPIKASALHSSPRLQALVDSWTKRGRKRRSLPNEANTVANEEISKSMQNKADIVANKEISRHIHTKADTVVNEESSRYIQTKVDTVANEENTRSMQDKADTVAKEEISRSMQNKADTVANEEISRYIQTKVDTVANEEISRYMQNKADTVANEEISRSVQKKADTVAHREISRSMQNKADTVANEEISRSMQNKADSVANEEISRYMWNKADTVANEEISRYMQNKADTVVNEEISRSMQNKADTVANEEISRSMQNKADTVANEEISRSMQNKADTVANEEISRFMQNKADTVANEEISRSMQNKADSVANEEISRYMWNKADTVANEEISRYMQNKADTDANEEISRFMQNKADTVANEEISRSMQNKADTVAHREIRRSIQSKADTNANEDIIIKDDKFEHSKRVKRQADYVINWTVDNIGSIYLDGEKQLGFNSGWTSIKKTSMPVTTKVVAFELTYFSGGWGFLASYDIYGWSTGTQHWRCTSDLNQSNWTQTDFDDSTWEIPKVIATNGASPWGLFPDISTTAKWIWAQGSNNDIYCRHSLFKEVTCPALYPPGNGYYSNSACSAAIPYYGIICIPVCNDVNDTLYGNSVITCQQDGTWNMTERPCCVSSCNDTLSVLPCGMTQTPLNDYHYLTNSKLIILPSIALRNNGSITEWKFYSETNFTFFPSIWRPLEDGQYKLVGYNKVTSIASQSEQVVQLSKEDEITSRKGDLLGVFVKSDETLSLASEKGTSTRTVGLLDTDIPSCIKSRVSMENITSHFPNYTANVVKKNGCRAIALAATIRTCKVTCPALFPPGNGYYSNNDCSVGSPYADTVCIPICNDTDDTLYGNSVITCQHDGTWNMTERPCCVSPCNETLSGLPCGMAMKPLNQDTSLYTSKLYIWNSITLRKNGTIIQWRFYSEKNSTFFPSIWRPVDDMYQLIGYNNITSVASYSEQIVDVSSENQIKASVGDCLGVFVSKHDLLYVSWEDLGYSSTTGILDVDIKYLDRTLLSMEDIIHSSIHNTSLFLHYGMDRAIALSATTITCEVTCPALFPPGNGYYSNNDCSVGSPYADTVCIPICNDTDDTLYGNSVITCQHDGTWNMTERPCCVSPCNETLSGLPCGMAMKSLNQDTSLYTSKLYIWNSIALRKNGTINQWRFYSEKNGTFFPSIWRPVDGIYQLIGYNNITSVASYSEQIVDVSSENQIKASAGDCLGVFVSKNDLLYVAWEDLGFSRTTGILDLDIKYLDRTLLSMEDIIHHSIHNTSLLLHYSMDRAIALSATAITCGDEETTTKEETTVAVATTTQKSTTISTTISHTNNSDREPYREDFLRESEVQEVLADLPEDVKRKLGYELDELVLSCQYENKDCNMSEFGHLFDAVYGNCYVFNYNPNELLSKQSGPGPGLKMVFDLGQHEYVEGISKSAGIVVVVHPKNRMPFPEDEGVFAAPGHVTSIGISMVSVSRLAQPYSTCSEEYRNPYINVYEELYDVEYSPPACYKTCYQKYVIERCNCSDPQYPSSRGKAFGDHNNTACSTRNIDQDNCIYGVLVDYIGDLLECNCPIPCRDTLYRYSLSKGLWPSEIQKGTFLKKYESSLPSHLNYSTIDSFLLRNIIKVEVYFKELNYQLMDEKPKYPIMLFLSDSCAILSLWLGMSLFSLLEFLELVTDLVLVTVLKFKKRNHQAVYNKRRLTRIPKSINHNHNDKISGYGSSHPKCSHNKVNSKSSADDRNIPSRRISSRNKDIAISHSSSKMHTKLETRQLKRRRHRNTIQPQHKFSDLAYLTDHNKTCNIADSRNRKLSNVSEEKNNMELSRRKYSIMQTDSLVEWDIVI